MNLFSLDYLRCHYLANQKCLAFMHTKVSAKQGMSLLALGRAFPILVLAKARIYCNVVWEEISHPQCGVGYFLFLMVSLFLPCKPLALFLHFR